MDPFVMGIDRALAELENAERDYYGIAAPDLTSTAAFEAWRAEYQRRREAWVEAMMAVCAYMRTARPALEREPA